jgi:hypothetical protein
MNIDSNTYCYNIQQLTYKKGFLDKTVDATYIIHLKNNGRLENINQQLNDFHPTKTIYIVFNKGYKKCSKPKFIDTSAKDLFDANIQIFKHANKMNYNNILILEDDFIFSEKINENYHINNINDFINSNNYKPFIYLLGCEPFFLMPYNYHTYRGLITGGMQAVIYNSQMRNLILQHNQQNIKNHDEYFNLHFYIYKYTYYIPLIYQLFPVTENHSQWGAEFGENLFAKYLMYIVVFLHKILKMDTQPEPGHSIFYFLSKLIFIIILFVIIFIISKLVYNTFKYSKKFYKKK